MLEFLEPEIVLVHVAMPDDVFCDIPTELRCVRYEDWITQKRKKVG